MALNEATLPLILFRKVKTIEHVIHGENIMLHFYILFHYFFGQCHSMACLSL